MSLRGTKACGQCSPDTLGVPRQMILSASAARPPLHTTAVEEELLQDALSAAACRGFDLSSELPLRAHLFEWFSRMRVERYRRCPASMFCFSSASHCIRRLVDRTVSPGPVAVHMARCAGTKTMLDALPVQYADYSLWQRTDFGEEGDVDSPLSRQGLFWREHLSSSARAL